MASSTIKVGVMFWKFSKHHEKVVRFFVYTDIQQNERNQMKIRWFSEEFRSLPANAEGSRKRAGDVSIIYHIYFSESRVQSPESSPVQSPVQLLDYAVNQQRNRWKHPPAVLLHSFFYQHKILNLYETKTNQPHTWARRQGELFLSLNTLAKAFAN